MKEQLFVYKNGDTVEVMPKSFSFELAMEGFISDNPNVLTNGTLDLISPEVEGYEMTIASDKRIDLLLRYANDTEAVVELKNVPVKNDALNQLDDYLRIFRSHHMDDNDNQLVGLLVGPEIEDSVLRRIETCQSLFFPIFGVELQRYFDDGRWFIFTRWYAPQKWNKYKKDYTKYILNNNQQQLGKGRLVLEVIKDYLSNHPKKTIAELQNAFPGSLRTRTSGKTLLQVIEDETKVKSEDRFRRYFKDLLSCADGNVVVSSQWGKGNIDAFVDHARKIGYRISTI